MPTATVTMLSLPDAATAIGTSYFKLLRLLKAHPEIVVPRVGGKRVITGEQLEQIRTALGGTPCR